MNGKTKDKKTPVAGISRGNILTGNPKVIKFAPLPNDGVVGGAGPMGWVAGGGAKLFKGALGFVKNVLGRSSKTSKTTGVIKNAFNKPPIVNQSRNLKQQWPSHKFKSGIGKRGSVSNMGRNEFLYHVMKKNDFLK